MQMRDESGAIIWENVKAAAQELLSNGVGSLCVIHFPEGGVAVSKDGFSAERKSDTVPVQDIVSSVGAGDAFIAHLHCTTCSCLHLIDYQVVSILETRQDNLTKSIPFL